MPRFTGKQYPGAMKDHRVAKRAEAEARQAESRLRTLQGMQQLGSAASTGTGMFQPLVHAFRAFVVAVRTAHDTTQNDYALAADSTRKG